MSGRAQLEGIREYRRIATAAPMLDPGSERELVRRFQRGDQVALGDLLTSHLRLVLSIAKRYVGQGVCLEDLVSEGNLGLVEAARRFQAARGTRFGTYAGWWVRAHVRRFALANRRIVPAPSTRNARRIFAGLGRTQRNLAQQLGRCAARAEVAARLGVPEEDIAMVETALGARDVTIGPGEGGTVCNVATTAPSPEQEAAEGEVRLLRSARVKKALGNLSAREQEIMKRRYLDEDTATLAVLGRSLGLSRERVRQIEKRAQLKLRSALLECVA